MSTENLLVGKPGADADFLIHAGEWATVWQFEPVTEAAKEFVEENLELEDWQKLGGTFACDHRPARQLARQLSDEGFVLFHPTYGYFVGRG